MRKRSINNKNMFLVRLITIFVLECFIVSSFPVYFSEIENNGSLAGSLYPQRADFRQLRSALYEAPVNSCLSPPLVTDEFGSERVSSLLVDARTSSGKLSTFIKPLPDIYPNLEVAITQDKAHMAKEAEHIIHTEILKAHSSDEVAILRMPTGNTPLKDETNGTPGVYDLLIMRDDIDWSRVIIFMLDEYGRSFDYHEFIYENFIKPLSEAGKEIPKVYCLVDPRSEWPVDEIKQYEQAIADYEEKGVLSLPVDEYRDVFDEEIKIARPNGPHKAHVGLYGLGKACLMSDGTHKEVHIAFNERGSTPDLRTRRIKLVARTIFSNRSDRGIQVQTGLSEDEIETMGIEGIRKALDDGLIPQPYANTTGMYETLEETENNVVIANGDSKVASSDIFVFGEPSPDNPAAYMKQGKARTVLIIDEAAASRRLKNSLYKQLEPALSSASLSELETDDVSRQAIAATMKAAAGAWSLLGNGIGDDGNPLPSEELGVAKSRIDRKAISILTRLLNSIKMLLLNYCSEEKVLSNEETFEKGVILGRGKVSRAFSIDPVDGITLASLNEPNSTVLFTMGEDHEAIVPQPEEVKFLFIAYKGNSDIAGLDEAMSSRSAGKILKAIADSKGLHPSELHLVEHIDEYRNKPYRIPLMKSIRVSGAYNDRVEPIEQEGTPGVVAAMWAAGLRPDLDDKGVVVAVESAPEIMLLAAASKNSDLNVLMLPLGDLKKKFSDVRQYTDWSDEEESLYAGFTEELIDTLNANADGRLKPEEIKPITDEITDLVSGFTKKAREKGFLAPEDIIPGKTQTVVTGVTNQRPFSLKGVRIVEGGLRTESLFRDFDGAWYRLHKTVPFDSDVVILVGPSGSGKTPLQNYIAGKHPSSFIVPELVSTRPRRDDNDVNKKLVSIEEFRAMEARGELLMVRASHGDEEKGIEPDLYGIHIDEIRRCMASGKTLLFDTTSEKGVNKIKEIFSQAKVLLVMPDALEVDVEQWVDISRKRISKRPTLTPEKMQARLQGVRDLYEAVKEGRLKCDFKKVYNRELPDDERERERSIFSKQVFSWINVNIEHFNNMTLKEAKHTLQQLSRGRGTIAVEGEHYAAGFYNNKNVINLRRIHQESDVEGYMFLLVINDEDGRVIQLIHPWESSKVVFPEPKIVARLAIEGVEAPSEVDPDYQVLSELLDSGDTVQADGNPAFIHIMDRLRDALEASEDSVIELLTLFKEIVEGGDVTAGKTMNRRDTLINAFRGLSQEEGWSLLKIAHKDDQLNEADFIAEMKRVSDQQKGLVVASKYGGFFETKSVPDQDAVLFVAGKHGNMKNVVKDLGRIWRDFPRSLKYYDLPGSMVMFMEGVDENTKNRLHVEYINRIREFLESIEEGKVDLVANDGLTEYEAKALRKFIRHVRLVALEKEKYDSDKAVNVLGNLHRLGRLLNLNWGGMALVSFQRHMGDMGLAWASEAHYLAQIYAGHISLASRGAIEYRTPSTLTNPEGIDIPWSKICKNKHDIAIMINERRFNRGEGQKNRATSLNFVNQVRLPWVEYLKSEDIWKHIPPDEFISPGKWGDSDETVIGSSKIQTSLVVLDYDEEGKEVVHFIRLEQPFPLEYNDGLNIRPLPRPQEFTAQEVADYIRTGARMNTSVHINRNDVGASIPWQHSKTCGREPTIENEPREYFCKRDNLQVGWLPDFDILTFVVEGKSLEDLDEVLEEVKRLWETLYGIPNISGDLVTNVLAPGKPIRVYLLALDVNVIYGMNSGEPMSKEKQTLHLPAEYPTIQRPASHEIAKTYIFAKRDIWMTQEMLETIYKRLGVKKYMMRTVFERVKKDILLANQARLTKESSSVEVQNAVMGRLTRPKLSLLDLWTGDGEFLRAVAKLNQESQKLVGIDLGPESEIIQDGNTEIEIRSFNTQGENWQQVIEQDEHDIVTLNYPDSSKLIDLVSVLELAAHGLKPEGICCVVLEPGDEVERVKIAMEGLFDSERIYTVDLPEEWPRSEYSLRNILREGHKMIVAVRPKVQLEPTAPAEVEVLEPETKEVAVTTVVSFDWSAFLHIWKSDRGFKKYVLDLMQRKDMRLVINSEGDKDLIRERLHEYYKEMGIDYEMEPEEIDIITVFPRGMRRPENKPQALNNWLKRRGIKPTVVIHVDDSDKDLMDFGYSLGLFKEAEVTTVGVSSSGGYSRHEIAPAGFSGKFDDILRSL